MATEAGVYSVNFLSKTGTAGGFAPIGSYTAVIGRLGG